MTMAKGAIPGMDLKKLQKTVSLHQKQKTEPTLPMSKEDAKFAKTQKLKKAGTVMKTDLKKEKEKKSSRKDKSTKSVMFSKPVDYEKIISENKQVIALEESIKDLKKEMLDTFAVGERKTQEKEDQLQTKLDHIHYLINQERANTLQDIDLLQSQV